jgi:hypothetical protein
VKTLRVITASAMLCLATALPAVGQTFSPYATGKPLQLVAEGSLGAKKDEYLQKSKAEMQEWQQKMKDFGEKAEVKGQDGAATTKSGLQQAWAKTKTESRKLETASAEGWESAKSSFEKASQNLKDSWHKTHPEEK